jgi:hypothetical protein
MLAITPELTMTDPRPQSDEMDFVSIDLDCAEPGPADATGVVYPLRVKSVSERERMPQPLAALAKEALRRGLRPAWATFTRGGHDEHAAQDVAAEIAPWDRRKLVPAFIAGLWIEDCDKKASRQFIL